MHKNILYLVVLIILVLSHSCEIQDYDETISPDELIQLEFENDTVNPNETSSVVIKAVLNDTNVSSDQDVTFETSGGYFTELPGGEDNLGKNHAVQSAGLKAQIILNLDDTITDDLIIQASIKEADTNRKFAVSERLFIEND